MNKILLSHGSGGRLTGELINNEIVSRFGDGPLKGLPDGASLDIDSGKIIFSTDSYVVTPIEFPGGNIGSLAVHGTVNDIAVSGGTPLWLSLSLILEEGLSLSLLRRILDSIKIASGYCNVKIATGDTKVVSKGHCDSIYINTAGIGEKIDVLKLGTDRVVPGDKIIVNGTLGDHGMAVMTGREGLNINNGPVSDSAPVHRLAKCLHEFGEKIKFMRDPTRGGIATVLNEIAKEREFGIKLKESEIPFSGQSKYISEILGIDLLHSASEGRLVLICAADIADDVIEKWSNFPEGKDSKIIGDVTNDKGKVILETEIGGFRFVDIPTGEILPRIC